ncbi:MAG: signal peptide peptidase SppA [Gammaproteobacteria bacterium]|nr:signal peptide peptidase SppA [Gammaproteobacteria bacterium]
MSQRKSLVVRVFGWSWRLLIGVTQLITALLSLTLLVLLWFGLRGGPPVHIGQHVALVVHPYGRLTDQPGEGDQRLLRSLSGRPPDRTPLPALRRALQFAATDPRIAAVVLDLDDMRGGGLAQLQELGAVLDTVRAGGKKVYAYGAGFDQDQYLLAAHADRITLDPLGDVLLQGLGVYTDYFKDALDKLGVQVHVFRVGDYKSAVEPFIRNDMSPAARTANQAWLDDLWGVYRSGIRSARKLPGGALETYVDGFATQLAAVGGDGAELAHRAGLVDRVATRQQFDRALEKLVGTDPQQHSFRQIDALDYARTMRREHPGSSAKAIGVVTVEGDIVDGQSDADSAGGDTIAGLLQRAAHDDDIGAVVLRVNSPGGSVSAAEQIRRALHQVQAAGKPVVVSMSNLAASGGYWISMDADRIFAEPTTITGSIGIFGLIPTIEKPLAKFGIHSDGVGTTPLAGAFRIDRPLDPAVAAIVQAEIDRGYRNFVDGVARGRELDVTRVEQIAQGRVWSGAAAKQLGLVDAFGGFPQALDAAGKLAKLTAPYRVRELQSQRAPLARYLSFWLGRLGLDSWNGDAGLRAVPVLGQLAEAQRWLAHLDDPHGEYAYCFCRPTSPAR